MKARKVNLRLITTTAMLAAISSVLMMLEFPLPIFPGFLQFDFSDLPALIGAFAFGPVTGVVIVLIKALIHATVSWSFGVGELANFIVGAALVFPAGIVYKYKKTRGGALLGLGTGVIVMAVVGIFANYYITIPFYSNFIPIDAIIEMCARILPSVDSVWKVVLLSITPFNLFKGVIVGLITFLTYKRLSWLIHGRYTKH